MPAGKRPGFATFGPFTNWAPTKADETLFLTEEEAPPPIVIPARRRRTLQTFTEEEFVQAVVGLDDETSIPTRVPPRPRRNVNLVSEEFSGSLPFAEESPPPVRAVIRQRRLVLPSVEEMGGLHATEETASPSRSAVRRTRNQTVATERPPSASMSLRHRLVFLRALAGISLLSARSFRDRSRSPKSRRRRCAPLFARAGSFSRASRKWPVCMRPKKPRRPRGLFAAAREHPPSRLKSWQLSPSMRLRYRPVLLVVSDGAPRRSSRSLLDLCRSQKSLRPEVQAFCGARGS